MARERAMVFGFCGSKRGKLRLMASATGEQPVACAPKQVKFFGAQATGCSPVADAIKRNLPRFEPQKPNTIARSLAIGNPADGPYALKLIRQCGGWAEDVSDQEIIATIKLLAETE